MSQDPKPEYEAPKVEQVDTADYPTVTVAGSSSDDVVRSDLRLKHSLRPLSAQKLSRDPEPDYEAPNVEKVETADTPAVTTTGDNSGASDERLKREVRPLSAEKLSQDSDYERPKVEKVDTEDAPAVTAAGTDSGDASDERLKRELRPLGAEKLSQDREPGYEAPQVEKIDTEDAPAVTAAGGDSEVAPSDLRLKRSLRSLDSIVRSR